MEKSYKISRIVLSIMTFIIFNIIFIHEDVDTRLVVPLIFSAIVFGLSFPSSVISRKLIEVGNTLESKTLKIAYYIFALPIIAFVVFYVIYAFLFSINGGSSTSNDLSSALGQAIMFLFWIVVIFICIVLPYVQSLVVLVINFFLDNK